MYSRPASAQDAKNRPPEFATREQREAWQKAHRCIPPWLLPPAERRRRHADETDEVDHERPASWLVAPVIFPMIERNSRRALGYCNATEYTLRLWAWVDTGHLYGERSISRRLRLEHARGRLTRIVIPREGRFRNGERSRHGTTANRFPSEKERRERLWREKIERRKQRREARQRKRAERVIRRPATESVAPVAPELQPARAPRTAIAEVVRPIASYEMPPMLRDALPRPELLDEAGREARAAEVARQLAAARAAGLLPPLEPPE